ncbi:hypothetical protein AOCH_004930 [Aspergillus ochraceoroseus]|uniref:Rieske domain-containing protein n=1 Tax=Aspergillus ochraceoroseus TaxID=138278 RepID=A0A0F8XJ58_9EURO|nr:hypothetical protein AOCH_004930 [Aspergillus ochraceoroseus]
MESLTSSFPALVALLAGVTFLYRVWSRPFVWNHPSPAKIHHEVIPAVTQNETHAVSKESDFPEDWLAGKGVFELERRALFSKAWVCLSHRARFSKAGDYQSIDLAGFPIVLILGKDSVVRAFHNVCRHRAYPVTKKECGSSTVLGCRYHGWSYNTYGQLIRAPHFDSVPGFDKAQNGLFAVHTFTSNSGFVFVNFETNATASSPETEVLDTFACRNRISPQSSWVSGQTLEARFNWKTALRSKQFQDVTEFEDQKASPIGALLSYLQRKPEGSSFFFPITSLFTTPSSGCWFSLSLLPLSEQKTSVRYDLYSYKKLEDEATKALLAKFTFALKEKIAEIEAEYDSYVIQKGDSMSLLSKLDPEDAETQQRILNLLKEHKQLEKARGTEVFPATREPRTNAKYEQAEQRA